MKNPKMVRRIAALLTPVLLAASMGGTAFAASDFTSGTYPNPDGNTTFTLRKDIVIKNAGGANKAYTPDITYNYTIAPANVGDNTKVTDSKGNSLEVKAGIADSVELTDAQADFQSKYVTLTDGRASVSDDITGEVYPEKFTAGGIYRYVITESAGNLAKLTKQGISRNTDIYKSNRYLDVYISKDADTGNMKVSGYVLFVAEDENAVIHDRDETKDTIIGKTEGFVDMAELTGGGEGRTDLADTCHTYNLTVQVDILGSFADETHRFPISIQTVSKEGTTRAFDYDVTVDGTTTHYHGEGPGINQPGGIVATPVSAELAKGDSITLYGLPADTSFNVTETNNNNDMYYITVKADAVTLPDKTNIPVAPKDAVAGVAGTICAFDTNTAISNYVDYTTPDIKASYNTILFENTLHDVSLTGVVLRIAPYAILLGAAILLGLFCLNGRKGKASKDVL